MNVKKLTTLSLSVAISMVLSFVESQIPPLTAVPGVKIGLANILTVFLLYTYGAREACAVSVTRVLLSSLLFGSAVSLLYSMAGALFSFLVMLFLKRLPWFSEIGVSIAGGVAHNVGQILAASLIMGTDAVLYYLPYLIISGVIAGIAVGFAANMLIHRVKLSRK